MQCVSLQVVAVVATMAMPATWTLIVQLPDLSALILVSAALIRTQVPLVLPLMTVLSMLGFAWTDCLISVFVLTQSVCRVAMVVVAVQTEIYVPTTATVLLQGLCALTQAFVALIQPTAAHPAIRLMTV
jgi:hypothetical protein